jgi:hypothetical protein
MADWQPIETAPKVGSVIDLWCVKDDRSWRLTNAFWSPMWKDWRTSRGEVVAADVPTHWMQVPDPPRGEKGTD